MKKIKNRVFDLLADKEKRERRRIKVAEIAHAIGVSPNTVAKWLTKDDLTQLDTNVLLGLCDYFGVTLHEMIYVEETDNLPAGDEAGS